jgi:hypothetical protein
LAEHKPLALYYSGSRMQGAELFDDKLLERLARGVYFAPQRKAAAGRSADAISPIYATGPQDDIANWPARGKALRQLADRARVKNDAGHALARVVLTRGHAVEEHWLKVVRARPAKYGDDEFIAEITTDSRLWPFLRAGERLRLSSYELLQLRSPAGDPFDAGKPSR